ncbi:hypothetical protein [Bdellovibrio sp. HCB2-146]|uniref:hypothetical protein n=1 Tax=Bdellovibrio sp. HCB2-146 TaxID=3394362 RepID=UPI0039BD7812
MILNLLAFFFLASAPNLQAALPPQFTDCMNDNSGTSLSTADMKEISKVSNLTVCQNQINLLSKYDAVDLLKSPNVKMGISLARTGFTRTDLMDMAKSGTYVLYVDTAVLDKTFIMDLQRAGVQIVVVSAGAGLTKFDMLDMAKVKPFILNLNSTMTKEDLRQLVTAGVQVVIRMNQAGLSRSDIIEVAKANAELVTVMP